MSIIIYFYSFNCWLLYNYTPYDLYFCDLVESLVSDEYAACAPGVKCFFVHCCCAIQRIGVGKKSQPFKVFPPKCDNLLTQGPATIPGEFREIQLHLLKKHQKNYVFPRIVFSPIKPYSYGTTFEQFPTVIIN